MLLAFSYPCLQNICYLASTVSKIKCSSSECQQDGILALQITQLSISSKLHVPFTICLGLTHYLIEHSNPFRKPSHYHVRGTHLLCICAELSMITSSLNIPTLGCWPDEIRALPPENIYELFLQVIPPALIPVD